MDERKPRAQLIITIIAIVALLAIIAVIVILLLTNSKQNEVVDSAQSQFDAEVSQQVQSEQPAEQSGETPAATESSVTTEELDANTADAQTLFTEMGVVEDYRASFEHGTKTAEYQKYIVLHDTEGWGAPASVINYWDGTGTYVAAHFIVDTDGTIYQCVPLDEIAHHAGWGSSGHNAVFAVEDESRDDMRGTANLGMTDYGMNSYSVGIEMVHVGDGSGYPQAQLDALDKLIVYIDAYYGFESEIISHNDWAIGNSDTSAEFEGYLNNYKDHRSYQ